MMTTRFEAPPTSPERAQELGDARQAAETALGGSLHQVAVLGPHGYAKALLEAWSDPGGILLLEHDLVLTAEAVKAFVLCPHAACTAAYRLYPATTGLQDAVWAHRTLQASGGPYRPLADHGSMLVTHGSPAPVLVWGRSDQGWADAAGLGCLKLTRAARDRLGADWAGNANWRSLDYALSVAAMQAGVRFHVHWPELVHLHR